MLPFAPILLALVYGLIAYRFSVWRTARDLDARSAPLADREVMRLVERMAGALGLERIAVHIYEVATVNGLAAPDGRIFLTRGFYEQFRQGRVTAEELAGVVAHELGHVALGHARRRMIDFSGQNAIRMALAGVLSRVLPGVGALIAAGLTSLLAARLSRQDEFEADAYASALLVKAGIGVAPQVSLFCKLEALTGAPGAGTSAWLLSHPRTTDRISAIEARAARWRGDTARLR